MKRTNYIISTELRSQMVYGQPLPRQRKARIIPVDPLVTSLTNTDNDAVCHPTLMAAAAKDNFKADKAFLDTGSDGLEGGDWFEFAYFHDVLKYPLHVTDQAISASAAGEGRDYSWKDTYDAILTCEAWMRILSSRKVKDHRWGRFCQM